MKLTSITSMFLVAMCAALCSETALAKTVRVSEFGGDAEDATAALRAALNSGADTVVIDARRWVTLPLRVPSNIEVVFEEGAVVEAKKGEYHDRNDCVFNLVCVSNVTLRGKGEVRMHHDDYLKPPYKRAEWRHIITILGSDNVRVSGLRLVQGGGDGVYVGAANQIAKRKHKTTAIIPWSSNIRLEDLYIDTNVRQGLSVTSCKGLVAERCVFKNTWGLPPEAGVDLEPNGPHNPIVGMVFRDCTFESNKGAGFEFALAHHVPGVSEPYDCLFERCRFVKDALVVHNTKPDHTQNTGHIVVRDCEFIDPKGMPLAVGMMPDRPFTCAIENCRIIENGVVTKIGEDWLVKNAPLLASPDRVPSVRTKVDYASLEVVDAEPGVAHVLPRIMFRNRVRFVVYADKARTLSFKGGYRTFGRFGRKKVVLTPLVVEDIAGNKIAEIPMPIYDKKNPPAFTFDAPKAGFYYIRAEMNRKGFILAEADAPVAADVTKDWQDVIGSEGTLSFYVPPKAPRFGVFVSGDGGECVAAEVKDSSGKSVWRNGCISAWAGVVPDAGAAASGLWSLTLNKPEKGRFEDERIDLIGLPGFFFLDSTRYWK